MTWTDATLEFYNAQIQVLKNELAQCGVYIMQDELSEKARALLDASKSSHCGDIPEAQKPEIDNMDALDG